MQEEEDAKKESVQDEWEEERLSRRDIKRRQRRLTIERAKKLASAVLEAIKNGKLIDGLAKAGTKMKEQREIFKEYDAAFEEYMKDMKDPIQEGEAG